jgi:hypothetical protein
MSFASQHPTAPTAAADGGDGVYRADGRADALGEALADAGAKQAVADNARANANANISLREQRIAQLNSAESPLWKKDASEADRENAMKELRQLIANDPEAQAGRANATVSELRDHFGLGAPEIRTGETYDHQAEGDFLNTAIEQGWDTRLVTDLRDYYVRSAQGLYGEITQDAIDDFHAAFERRLPKAERDQLVNWIVREFGRR